MSNVVGARAEIEKFIRALQQGKDRSFFTDFLERSGTAIVSGAKQRAPVDRGSLRRAISHRVTSSPPGLEVGILGGDAKSVPYGRLQEIGGTITVQKAQWLTIPLSSQYRDRRPRSFDLVFSTIGGKKFLVDRQTGETAYRLVKSVKIVGQPYLSPAIRAYLNTQFDRLLSRTLDQYFGGL
jgi:hypothetical protein